MPVSRMLAPEVRVAPRRSADHPPQRREAVWPITLLSRAGDAVKPGRGLPGSGTHPAGA